MRRPAGMIFHPSSRSAFPELAHIFFLPMRTVSTVARGSRPSMRPEIRFIHGAGDVGNEVWQLHGGRGQAGDRAEFVENLFERQVLTAENVALAALAFFERRNVAAGALANVDQIQSGFHVGGKFSLQKVDDDAAGGSRLDVLLADRSGGIHGYHAHAAAAGFERNLFGHEFRALVVADHIGQGNGRIFVGGTAVSGESDGGDA